MMFLELRTCNLMKRSLWPVYDHYKEKTVLFVYICSSSLFIDNCLLIVMDCIE